MYFDEITLNEEIYELTVLVAASAPEEQSKILDMLEAKTLQYIQ